MLREITSDPDAGGKLSAGRTPLVVWFVLVTLVAVAIGVALLWTHVDCAGAAEASCEPLAYEAVGPYLDRMLDAFWAFGATYGVGKLAGKWDGSRRGEQ